jgi:hypothetical protein
MLTPIPEYALPYTPIPLDRQQSILGPIREGLLQREFAPSAILPDYVFTAEKKGLKVHQTAFTDPLRKDPLTSAVNFYYNAERLTHQRILRTSCFRRSF